MKTKKKSKTNESFFSRNYKLSWNYLKESRKAIYLSIVLFILFFVIAIIFPAPALIEEQIKDIIKQLIDKFEGKNLLQTMFMIFGNNALVSLIGLFLGILFSFVPLVLAISNGYMIGYVSKIVVSKTSIFEMWRLLPHGIFELPAVFISLGLGLRLGLSLFYKNADKKIIERLKKSLRVFIFVVLPLLVVAAVIEGLLIKIIG